MESSESLFPFMMMEETEMAMATFNINLQQLMDSVDDKEVLMDEEFLDIKPFSSPLVSSSFTSKCDYSHREMPIQISPSKPNGCPRFMSSPQIISFGNNNNDPTKPSNVQRNLVFSEEDDEDLGYMNNRRISPIKRTPQQARLHVLAERKRRKKLRDSFVTLSKVVPGITKLDKATILEDAMKHIKELEERVMILEKNTKKNLRAGHGEERSVNMALLEEDMPEIKVTIEAKNVLIKILCDKKYQRCVSKMLEELKKLHLHISDTSVLQFGGCAMDITFSGKIQSQFSATVDSIMDHLRIAVFQVQM